MVMFTRHFFFFFLVVNIFVLFCFLIICWGKVRGWEIGCFHTVISNNVLLLSHFSN